VGHEELRARDKGRLVCRALLFREMRRVVKTEGRLMIRPSACRGAENYRSLRFVLSGSTDAIGTELYCSTAIFARRAFRCERSASRELNNENLLLSNACSYHYLLFYGHRGAMPRICSISRLFQCSDVRIASMPPGLWYSRSPWRSFSRSGSAAQIV
jgi:hypothetical protein